MRLDTVREPTAATEAADTEEDLGAVRTLLSRLGEDVSVNGRRLGEPSLHAVVVYRLGVWGLHQPPLLRRPVSVVYRLAYAFVRNVYRIELPRQARIGRRLRIGHHGGIVVTPYASVGDDCFLRHNVTLARTPDGRSRKGRRGPSLGDGVEVGVGAVIVGGVDVGAGARIGPNAVIATDVPAGGSAFAPPAKVLSLRPAEG